MIVNITTRERTSAKKGVYVQFILLYGEGKRLRRQKVIKNCWYSVNASEAEKDRMAKLADRVLKKERAKAVATAYDFKEVAKPKELDDKISKHARTHKVKVESKNIVSA